jgi:hypothetical protein
MKANQYLTASLTNLQRRISNWAMALCLLGGLLAPAAAQAASSDDEVPFTEALADAHQVTNLNNGWKVYVSQGDSMLPQISHNSLLMVDRADFDKLTVGMLVIYRDAAGDLVSHRLIQHTSEGWVAKGLNNTKKDPGLVTRDNLQGVVFGMMRYQAGSEKIAVSDATKLPSVAYAKKY